MLWLALAATTLLKLYLALFTEGSKDVAGFRDHLEKIHAFGVEAYRIRGAFNNPFNSPPPMIYVIRFWGWLANSTGVRFGFWLRLPSIIADIGSFVIVAGILRRLWPNRNHFWPLLGMVLCPTAIVISGYHGNTDSVMIFLVLLSIYLINKPWAGLVFGLALCVKVLPLAFAPAIFFYIASWKRRIIFFGLAAGLFVICSMPYLVQEPFAVRASVFGYSSVYGKWGLTQLAALFFPRPPTYLHGEFDVQGEHLIFAQILKVILIAAVVVSSWHFRQNLYLAIGVTCGVLLFLAPGFGIQYLIWPIPFVPSLGKRSFVYYTSSSLCVLTAGDLCSGRLICFSPPVRFFFGLACWLSLVVMILALHRLYHSRSNSNQRVC